MQKYQKFPYVVIVLWIFLLIIGGYLYFHLNLSIEEAIFGAKKYVLENRFQGILFFIILYTIRPLFFIIASPFDIFSGMVFGPVYGFIISTFGTFGSTVFSYGIGRITGGGFIQKRSGERIGKFKNKLNKDAFFTALVMRLLLLPYDLGNYICGAFKAPFKKYVAGTSLGIMPATFVVVSAGSAFYGQEVTSYQTLLQNIKYENLWFASGFFITILLVSQVLKKKYKNITL